MKALIRFSQDRDGSMEPDEFGEWVRYEDVEESTPPGFWLAPDEPTEEMKAAMHPDWYHAVSAYRYMRAAYLKSKEQKDANP